MREIKFRAWIKDEEKIIYPNERNYYIRTDGGLFRIVKLSDKKGQNFLSIETEASIMQFTGLLDKNGKEIYESDILSYPREEQIISIRWDNGGYWAFDERREFDDGVGRGDWRLTTGICFESEVIGNMWENPELLNK